jgi:hypothetical protein
LIETNKTPGRQLPGVFLLLTKWPGVAAANAEIFAAYVRGPRSILGWSRTELARRTGLT